MASSLVKRIHDKSPTDLAHNVVFQGLDCACAQCAWQVVHALCLQYYTYVLAYSERQWSNWGLKGIIEHDCSGRRTPRPFNRENSEAFQYGRNPRPFQYGRTPRPFDMKGYMTLPNNLTANKQPSGDSIGCSCIAWNRSLDCAYKPVS